MGGRAASSAGPVQNYFTTSPLIIQDQSRILAPAAAGTKVKSTISLSLAVRVLVSTHHHNLQTPSYHNLFYRHKCKVKLKRSDERLSEEEESAGQF